MVALIHETLKDRQPYREHKRISALLRACSFEITRRTLWEMKNDPEIAAFGISAKEHLDGILTVLRDLADMLESAEPHKTEASTIHAAAALGKQRFQQGYRVSTIATCVRLLERAMYDVLQERFLSLNQSFPALDFKRLHESLALQLEVAQKSFLESGRAA